MIFRTRGLKNNGLKTVPDFYMLLILTNVIYLLRNVKSAYLVTIVLA